MESRFIVEKELYKIKGVVGALHMMAVADTSCIPFELPDTAALLEDVLREVCHKLQSIVDGTVE